MAYNFNMCPSFTLNVLVKHVHYRMGALCKFSRSHRVLPRRATAGRSRRPRAWCIIRICFLLLSNTHSPVVLTSLLLSTPWFLYVSYTQPATTVQQASVIDASNSHYSDYRALIQQYLSPKHNHIWLDQKPHPTKHWRSPRAAYWNLPNNSHDNTSTHTTKS